MLATALRARRFDGPGTIFASGVSNSQETSSVEFEREATLLAAHLKTSQGPFVYFSTCSISDPDRAKSTYVTHKLQMEKFVATHPNPLILRLPQVVGKTSNPNTLTNFIANNITHGTKFSVWKNALRCIVDVEDVATIASALLQSGQQQQYLYEVAPPETVSMLELVKMMEQILNLPAQYELLDRGGGTIPDPSIMLKLAGRNNIDLTQGYTLRILDRYYGQYGEA